MKYKRRYQTERPKLQYVILEWLYFQNGLTRKLFYFLINHFEGGQFYSTTLRKIFKDNYDITVGIGSYGCFTTNFRPHVKIGNYCSIAPGVQRLVGNHTIDNVSTHPIFYSSDFGCVDVTDYTEHHLTIGNDVWIGVNAIITGNVEYIGDGAIIGAGAVVTKNVEPYTIVGGVPAKFLRRRFSVEDGELLMDSHWYDFTPDILRSAILNKANLHDFVNSINNIR